MESSLRALRMRYCNGFSKWAVKVHRLIRLGGVAHTMNTLVSSTLSDTPSRTGSNRVWTLDSMNSNAYVRSSFVCPTLQAMSERICLWMLNSRLLKDIVSV